MIHFREIGAGNCNLTPADKLAILDQLVPLEGVADGMHDSVLQHRVDAVARPPTRRILGTLQLFVGNLWPGTRWLRRRFTKAVVSGDRLRYETGFTSTSPRTIQLSKLQDVRVVQGWLQRLLNIGDLSLETSGETSRLTIRNIDAPQTVADDLMNRSQTGSAKA